MKLPPSLQKGDTVALVSPARYVDASEIEHFVYLVKSHGWNIRIDEAALARYHQFGGTDLQRARHLQAMLDDPEVKAIVGTRGGYGCMRIVDMLDFRSLMRQPKWIVGFSDFTVIHAQLQKLGLCSLHAPMAFNFGHTDNQMFELMASFLEGNPVSVHIPKHHLNRFGEASAAVVGGNLSLLAALKGSASFPPLHGNILFIEDVDEYLYHIDRMMLSLRRAGLLSQLAGLIVGAFTQMKDNAVPFGALAEEIILSHVSDYDYPVCFGFPAGHINPQQPLILGAHIDLRVSTEGTFVHYS